MKSDDDIQTTLSNTKKGEEEERTQHDDSNVRMECISSDAVSSFLLFTVI